MTVLQIWEETCVIWELAIRGWVTASERREVGELICGECVKQTQGHAVHNHRVSASVCACGGVCVVSLGFCCFDPFLAHESAVRDGSSLRAPARKAWKLQRTHGWVLGSSEASSLVCGVQCWPSAGDRHGTLPARLCPWASRQHRAAV